MVGLFLAVYVREDIFDKISDVDCDRVKTGVFHLAGNKGAVCLRFTLTGSSFCFLNVHLQSGQENQAARNQNIDDALRYAFQGLGAHGQQRDPKYNFRRESAFIAPLHHVTFIFGDFNFRLDVPADGFSLDEEPATWLEHDPWRKGLVEGLEDFTEGEINFPPTYKYRPGTDELDEKRIPAWCDRVLYKAMPNVCVFLRHYTSLPVLRHTSDHRPVVAELEVSSKRRLAAFRNSTSSRSWLSLLTGDPQSAPEASMSSTSSRAGLRCFCCWAAMCSIRRLFSRRILSSPCEEDPDFANGGRKRRSSRRRSADAEPLAPATTTSTAAPPATGPAEQQVQEGFHEAEMVRLDQFCSETGAAETADPSGCRAGAVTTDDTDVGAVS